MYSPTSYDFSYYYGFNEKPMEIKKKCESGFFIKKNGDLKINKSVYGSVSELCDKNNNCKYVVKLIPLKSKQYFETFLREALIAPIMYKNGIGPKIYDMFICLNAGYIIMEKYEGTIRNIIQDVYENNINTICTLIRKMHSIGIIHNDLHTGNILYRKNEDNTYSFVIIDFGLSLYFEDKNKKIPNEQVFYNLFPNIFYPAFDFYKLSHIFEKFVSTPSRPTIDGFITNKYLTLEEYYIINKFLFFNNNGEKKNLTMFSEFYYGIDSSIKNSRKNSKNNKNKNSLKSNILDNRNSNNSIKKKIL